MNEQTVIIDAPAFPPPPPNAAPPPTSGRRWYQLPVSRDPDDHKVGGVIGGLSRTYGFDVRTTRIAVLITTIVLPVLLVLYLTAWMLLPAAPSEAVSFEHIVRDRRRMPIYIAIGVVLLAGGIGSFSSWFFFGGISWGLVLVAVGVLLWVAPGLTRSSVAPAPYVPPEAPAPISPMPAPASRWSDAPTTTAPTTTVWTGSRPVQLEDVRPRRKRRPIASLVTLAVLAFIAIAAAGDALDWWNIPVLTTIIVSLITTAVGAAVSAIVNRSWIALPVIPLLAVVTTGLLITHPNLDGGIGERTLTPSTVAAAERTQHLAMGELTIDFSNVPLGDDPVDVRVEVGLGHMHLVVPRDATIVIDSQIGAGDVVVDGEPIADGIRHSDQRTLQPAGASTGTINLDVELGAGRIDIDRAL